MTTTKKKALDPKETLRAFESAHGVPKEVKELREGGAHRAKRAELLKLVPESPRTGMEGESESIYCGGFEECVRLITNRIKRKFKA